MSRILERGLTNLERELTNLERGLRFLERELTFLRTEMNSKFGVVDEQFKAMLELVKSEGETTRRHFDVVAEKMLGERKPGAG